MALNRVWLITRNSTIKGIIKGINCTTKKCQCKFAHIRIKGIIKGIPFYNNDIVGDA